MIDILEFINECIDAQLNKIMDKSTMNNPERKYQSITVDSFDNYTEYNYIVKNELRDCLSEIFIKMSISGFHIKICRKVDEDVIEYPYASGKDEIYEIFTIINNTIEEYRREIGKKCEFVGMEQVLKSEDLAEMFTDMMEEVIFDLLVSGDGGTWISEKYNFIIMKNNNELYYQEELHDLYDEFCS